MKNYSFHRFMHETHDEESHAMLRIIYTVVAVWFFTAFIGGVEGIFDQPGGPPVPVGIFVLLPIVGFILAYAVSPRVRRAVDGIPLWFITIAHTWRFIGLGFMIGAMVNILPPQFGYPEGLGDIVTAVFCLPLARALRKHERPQRLRAAFITWNVFGLIDLVSAITLGILYSPSTFGILRTGISTELMTRFPVNLIPAFFVPLFILLHVLALKRSKEIVRD